MARLILVGQAYRCVLGRTDRIGDRLVHITARSRLDEVMGQLAQMRLRLHTVQLLQRRTDLPMEADAAVGRQLVVEGFPNQRVGEAVLIRSA